MFSTSFKKLSIATGVATLMLGSQAHALEPFNITLSTEGETASQGFEDLETLVDQLDVNRLTNIVNAYTSTSIATATLDIRGLSATAAFQSSGTDLVFSIPSLNFTRTFTGATRDDSVQALENFLETNGDDLLTRILQTLAATTLIDPVAGNPKSLMSNMASADFDNATGGGATATKQQEAGTVENQVAIGARFGSYSAGPYKQSSITIPVRFTSYLDTPGHQLIIDAPIELIETEGAQSYNLSLGLGYRFPITEDWSLTPAVRAGAVGSVDLGAAAVIYSGSVTSNYDFIVDDDMKLSIGNMLGVYQTTGISAGDYSIDYDLFNSLMKNGVMLEQESDTTLFNKGTSWQASLANTQFFGDELAVENYFDLAVSWGTSSSFDDGSWNDLRVGATYTFGDDYDGFTVNLGYKF